REVYIAKGPVPPPLPAVPPPGEQKPIFMRYLIAASGEQIFPEGGGLQIRDGTGEVIGAVGVTGDTEERDEELAAHAIRSVGLKTDGACATPVGGRRGIRLTDT